MTFDAQPINILLAIGYWAGIFLAFLVLVGIGSFLITAATQGLRGPKSFFLGIANGVQELFSLSPRRLWALTMLTFKEAIRRKALLVFVVFAILFMFAGWFLTGGTVQQKDFQAKVYISFALRAITWLLLPVMLILSCWGLPEDIKNRSLHTVVTKPARRMEVVLGRMMGFGLIGTLILVVMGFFGYIWVVREVPPNERQNLICRDPLFGQLKFTDQDGVETATGRNVGDLVEFRSFIEGATKARAIWTIDGVDRGILHPNNCFQLESRFEAFRTHKGKFDRTVFFQYTLVNPDKPDIRVPLSLIPIQEFRNNSNYVTVAPTVQLADEAGKPLGAASAEAERDFFQDLVSNGKLQIEVACIDPGQYIGMSRIDLFFRKPDRWFLIGYLKALLGIECQMLLIVFLGVAASTFVKGPVATFLTAILVLVGYAQEFMNQLLIPAEYGGFSGGGVFESIYRMVMHMNPTTELPSGPAFYIMQLVDWMLKLFLWSVRYFIPNSMPFGRMPEYVANGFDVNFMAALLPGMLVTLGFFIPCLFVGYYSLQSRELESK